VLQELWSLAGIEPVGGRRPAEIAHRLVERAQAARAGALSAGEADAVRAFLAVSDRPGAALDAISALGGPQRAALDAALDGWRKRLAGMVGARRPGGPHAPDRRLRAGVRLLRRLPVRGAQRRPGRGAARGGRRSL
jgi:ATP phosphoribosyltransferase regulatory subunit HisZ